MLQPDIKQNFLIALNKMPNPRYPSLFFPEEQVKKMNKIVIKGEKFLAALDELKVLLAPASISQVYDIVVTATDVLNHTTSYNELFQKIDLLKQRMEEDSAYIRSGAVCDMFFRSISFCLSAVVAIAGALIFLSMSSFGAFALGGFMLTLGTISLMNDATNVAKNYRLFMGKQLEEVNEFLNLIKPVPLKPILLYKREVQQQNVAETPDSPPKEPSANNNSVFNC